MAVIVTIPIPDGSVIVTPAQMFAEMRDMHDEIKSLRSEVSPVLTDIRSDVQDHEGRLRVLEANRWKQAGIVGAVSALMSSGLAVGLFEAITRK